ncbi:TPA: restriction endonuclease subunit S [Vibrio vulnificus]|nr:restriction endonuclease subunit S [Vibrio vulnificus]
MTGRYKAYAEYKDSGVEWVGSIPTHWGLKKLKYLAPLIGEKATEKTNPIALEHIQSWTGKLISSDSTFEGDGTKFKAGDILFGKLRPYLAKVYLTKADGEAIGDFHVMRPISNSYGKFLKSLMLTKDYIATVDASTYGAKMPRASWDFTSNIQLPFCSEVEAEKIANFLDHETSKIDTLIDKQEKLIELLKEKRQAVISHAVTKGLNPHVPMKDSGVEWLGDVPEHWQIVKLSYFLKLLSGDGITSNLIESEGKYPVMGGNGFRGYTSTYNCDGDYALIGRQGALCGNINIAKGKFFASEHAVVVYPHKEFNLTFLSEFLRFMNLGQYSVSAAQPGISVERINGLKIVIPPLAEQELIGDFIDRNIHRFEELTLKSESMIMMLKERKAALISAAVTGKIDVRDWQEPTYQEGR